MRRVLNAAAGWWRRPAVAVALMVMHAAIEAQVSGEPWQPPPGRVFAAQGILAYVAAFWVMLGAAQVRRVLLGQRADDG